MHLSVISLPLHKRGDTKSIIFFHEGTVLIQPDRAPGEHNDPPPVEEHVPANTIVINTHTEGGMGNDLDIYHECIHYEWHYLFYRLQDMHNNDLKQLKKVRRSAIKDKDTADPTYFMEYQARYGSYGLLLPKSFMLETVDRLYKDAFEGKRKDGYYDHDGRRYEYVARKIADEYVISKASVRARMIQLGYIAALGALNFVDGHYIVPFAFSDIGSCSGDGTYVIDRKSVSLLYRKDKEFKRIMQSGNLVCKVEACLKTVLGATLCNWSCLMNNFYKEAAPNPHIHIHVRPRYDKPVMLNESIYTDSEFGHHYALKKSGVIPAKDKEEVFIRLKEWLNR